MPFGQKNRNIVVNLEVEGTTCGSICMMFVYVHLCIREYVRMRHTFLTNSVYVLQSQLHMLPREGQAVRCLRRRQMDRDGEGGARRNRRHRSG